MVTLYRLVRSWATAFTLVAFLIVGLWGVVGSLKIAGHVGMIGCPFSAEQVVVCPMTLSQHILSWRNMFTTTLPPETLLAFWLVAVSLIVFSLVSLVFGSTSPPGDYLRGYLRTHLGLGREQYLLEALSNGTIQPKLYN